MTKTLPPFAREHRTSLDAAVSMYEPASSLRERVFAWFEAHGPATDQEMLAALALRYQTGIPRRWELVNAGRLEDSGERGRTTSGRKAIRWRVREAVTAETWAEVMQEVID